MSETAPWSVALVAGGVAGLSVDVGLYPLDTLKTRLQSPSGFWASGGFSRMYAGLAAAAAGSAPGAALFFCTYDTGLRHLYPRRPEPEWRVPIQMGCAAMGEAAACVVRVPVEIVKQRRQAGVAAASYAQVRDVVRHEGVRGLYRGYLTTLLREIPFAFIQFPLWEGLKRGWARRQAVTELAPWQSSVCGAVAGATSAALTTPLDVAKTRIMLAERHSPLAQRPRTHLALRIVLRERGLSGLWAGVVPRTIWIALGGAIFFGVYDGVKSLLNQPL